MLLLLQTLLLGEAFGLVLLQSFKEVLVDDDLGYLVDTWLSLFLRLLHLLLRLLSFLGLPVFVVLVQLQESRVGVTCIAG